MGEENKCCNQIREGIPLIVYTVFGILHMVYMIVIGVITYVHMDEIKNDEDWGVLKQEDELLFNAARDSITGTPILCIMVGTIALIGMIVMKSSCYKIMAAGVWWQYDVGAAIYYIVSQTLLTLVLTILWARRGEHTKLEGTGDSVKKVPDKVANDGTEAWFAATFAMIIIYDCGLFYHIIAPCWKCRKEKIKEVMYLIRVRNNMQKVKTKPPTKEYKYIQPRV